MLFPYRKRLYVIQVNGMNMLFYALFINIFQYFRAKKDTLHQNETKLISDVKKNSLYHAVKY